MEKGIGKHIKKEKTTTEKGKNKDMIKKDETEFKKIILMTMIEKKERGNEDKRKWKMKDKRTLEGN